MRHELVRSAAALLICLAAALIPRVAAADRPNFDLFVYRRAYTPSEHVSLRLSVYNEKVVRFDAYSIDLPSLTPTSKAMERIKSIISSVDVAKIHPAKSWQFAVGKSYPDQWGEREVKAPTLKPGVYLIRARANAVEKRTWLAITDTALVTKRSRQELLVYAVGATTGHPQANTHLAAVDVKGNKRTGVTDNNGIWRSQSVPDGNLWLTGSHGAMPAFLLAGAPPAPDPYAVHISTDRPIYRPGNTVLYRGTVRERLESNAPSGFTLRPYAGKKIVVEIRDSTDALIARHEVTTNNFGSFDSSVQLASEPPLGNWQIIVVFGKFRVYSAFDVEEYRKPEFTVGVQFAASHLEGGSRVPVTIDARYFFGQPVAGASVAYQVEFAPEDGNPQGRDVEPAFDGQGVTGSDGKFTLDLQTKRLPLNRRLTVSATVTDISRRAQQGSGSTLITSGKFRISLEADRDVVRVNSPIAVTVTATDYDDRPIATPVEVRLVETRFDRQHRPVATIVRRNFTTSASGKGTVTFTPQRPGYLRLEAEAFDAESNKIAAGRSIWVAGDEDADVDYPTLNLIADRQAYRPGQTANILINTSLIAKHTSSRRRDGRDQDDPSDSAETQGRERGYALVTVEGEKIYSVRTISINSKSTSISVPIVASYFPSVQVSVLIVMDRHIYEQEAPLPVERDDEKLKVTVQPSRARYKPGEIATYAITTRDYLGRPVPAEVSIGVVDASIYALRPDSTPDLFATFYSGQDVRVETDFSFAAQYSGGAFQTMPAPAVAKPSFASSIRVRRQFADTAYWNPSVVTDNNGSASVNFTLADNLTTWRATARAITSTTHVGAGTSNVISTMPLQVRLELPRFYVAGDEAVVSAVVHNGTEITRLVHASIESTGAQLSGDSNREITLEAGKDVRLDWKAKINQDGDSVRFLVTADGGPGGQDATDLTLPKREDGLHIVEADADEISADTGVSNFDLTKLPPNTTVTISLSPSLAEPVFAALDYLQTYPYGCAEQTMSSFLPDVVVARALRRLHGNQPLRPNLDSWVALGIQKLYRYQHLDGGWNWWEDDQTDGDMTAYVLWGLVQARDAGYLVDDHRVNRGTEALLRLLKNQKELNARADWLLTLSFARPKAVGAQIADAYAHRNQLDTYALASLGLALVRIGASMPARVPGTDFGRMALTVAGELEARAVRQGTTVYWPAAVGGYTWREGDVSVTAHVLRAILLANGSSGHVPGAVRWLMGNRRYRAWDSTRSSAEAVFALAQVMETTRELQSNYRVKVLIDGTSVQDVTFGGSGAQKLVTLTPEMLRGRTALRIEKNGPGVLYASIARSFTIPSGDAMPLSRGLTVHRTYRISAEDPARADSITSGQDFDVQTEITADANYRYAILEDPIPAGCEVDAGSAQGNAGYYVRQEVRDNRAVFFFDNLPKGKTVVSYHLHAETPGVYRILPSISSLVYFPEIRGNGAPVRAKIVEK